MHLFCFRKVFYTLQTSISLSHTKFLAFTNINTFSMFQQISRFCKHLRKFLKNFRIAQNQYPFSLENFRDLQTFIPHCLPKVSTLYRHIYLLSFQNFPCFKNTNPNITFPTPTAQISHFQHLQTSTQIPFHFNQFAFQSNRAESPHSNFLLPPAHTSPILTSWRCFCEIHRKAPGSGIRAFRHEIEICLTPLARTRI